MFNSAKADFLAHSVELEAEARQRYRELADVMAAHNNPEVAAFFRAMADEASQHLAEVERLVGDMSLPRHKAWEFNWPAAEAPETTSYEALHYRMSLRQAMVLALENERAAESYYREVAAATSDPETAALAREFAQEEASHAGALEKRIDNLSGMSAHHREDDDPPHTPE